MGRGEQAGFPEAFRKFSRKSKTSFPEVFPEIENRFPGKTVFGLALRNSPIHYAKNNFPGKKYRFSRKSKTGFPENQPYRV
jgi:hypothetical protein